MDGDKVSMEGIYSISICEIIIDEVPRTYKPTEDIIGTISEAISIIGIMKPIYNFKDS